LLDDNGSSTKSGSNVKGRTYPKEELLNLSF